MACGLSVSGSSQAQFLPPLPNSLTGPISVYLRPTRRQSLGYTATRREKRLTICFVLEERQLASFEIETESRSTSTSGKDEGYVNITTIDTENGNRQIAAARLSEKLARKRSERFTYLVAAVMSSFGVTSLAIMAVYYRFYWQMEVKLFEI